MATPKVTVVIPAYNEERFLREALDSVVNQVDCVIIGDNASTDDTESICREYEKKYPHVRYVRHDQNIGSLENLKFLIQKVDTELCFHMGAHDLVPPDYVAKLVATLNPNPDAVAAYADCYKIDENNQTYKQVCYKKVYDRTTKKIFPQLLTSDIPQERIIAFLLNADYSFLIFGLFRTDVARKSWADLAPIAGCDEVAMYDAAIAGKLVYCRETRFLLRLAHKNDSYKQYIERIVGVSEKTQSTLLKNNKRDYTPYANRIKEIFAAAPIPSGFEQDARQIYKRLCFKCARRTGAYSGLVWIDFYLLCCKVGKFIFDVRFSKNKKYVKLFGVTLYDN